MKKAKLKNNLEKHQKPVVENEFSIKKLLVTIVILVLVFAIFYFITTLVIKPTVEEQNDEVNTEADSSKIIFNHLLDRKEKEYYVLATMKSKYLDQINYDTLYNKYISDYSNSEDSLKVYRVDLDDSLKDGKIEHYYVGNTEILDALSEL